MRSRTTWAGARAAFAPSGSRSGRQRWGYSFPVAVILAIDQGTTGTTCIVFGEDGRERGRGYSEFEQHFPEPGWVEHDAAEIWEVTRKVAMAALGDAGVQGADLKGIGPTRRLLCTKQRRRPNGAGVVRDTPAGLLPRALDDEHADVMEPSRICRDSG